MAVAGRLGENDPLRLVATDRDASKEDRCAPLAESAGARSLGRKAGVASHERSQSMLGKLPSSALSVLAEDVLTHALDVHFIGAIDDAVNASHPVHVLERRVI